MKFAGITDACYFNRHSEKKLIRLLNNPSLQIFHQKKKQNQKSKYFIRKKSKHIQNPLQLNKQTDLVSFSTLEVTRFVDAPAFFFSKVSLFIYAALLFLEANVAGFACSRSFCEVPSTHTHSFLAGRGTTNPSHLSCSGGGGFRKGAELFLFNSPSPASRGRNQSRLARRHCSETGATS